VQAEAEAGPVTFVGPWSETSKPVALMNPEWAVFMSYWEKVKLDDFDGYKDWVEAVKMLCWKNWLSIKFIYLSNAASGHSTSELRNTTLDKQEYSSFLKACKVLVVGHGNFSLSDVDFLFIACDNRYDFDESPKGCLMLYQFMDILVRCSVYRFGRPDPKKPNPKAQLPGCFEDMMDNFVLKYQGEAADDDTKVKQYVQSPAASMVREEKAKELQAIFDSVSRLEGGGGDSLVNISEWMTLFIKGNKFLIKGITRATVVMSFALAQEIADEGLDGHIDKMEGEMLRVLDYEEFCIALSRLCYSTLNQKKMAKLESADVLKEFVTILGPWIKDLAGDKKPIGAVRPLKKAEKPATPRDSRESSAKKETKAASKAVSTSKAPATPGGKPSSPAKKVSSKKSPKGSK